MGNQNSGRKSKEVDQKMIEELSNFSDDVYKVLHANILAGKHWAIKIWFDRVHGKAVEQSMKPNTFTVRLNDNHTELLKASASLNKCSRAKVLEHSLNAYYGITNELIKNN